MTAVAIKRCWLSREGGLVAEGDESARALFARVGQKIPASTASRFSNAAEFFSGVGPTQGEPIKRSPGRPRKLS